MSLRSYYDKSNKSDAFKNEQTDSRQEMYQIKQSAYFHHEKKNTDQYEFRFQAIDEKLAHHEDLTQRKLDHIEERVRQVNQKFERIEQLGDRLESLNKLIDTLKTNFDAKLNVFEDKYNGLNSKLDKKLSLLKTEMLEKIDKDQSSEISRKNKNESSTDDMNHDIQHLYQLIKRTLQGQKDIQNEVQQLKNQSMTKDIRQSEVLCVKTKKENSDSMVMTSGILKQSNVIYERREASSPSSNCHQRIESFKSNGTGYNQSRNDRVRSITLEKEKQMQLEKEKEKQNEARNQRNEPIEEEMESKHRKTKRNQEVEKSTEVMDKYQFTLQSRPFQQIDQNINSTNTNLNVNVECKQKNEMKFELAKQHPLQLNKSQAHSQQNQLRMTSTDLGRDRIQSKGSSIAVKEPEPSKTGKIIVQEKNAVQNVLVNGNATGGAGKYLLERAVSQDNFSRSKYLSNERVSGEQGMLVREQLKNMRK